MGYFITLAVGILALLYSLHLFSESLTLIKTGNRTTATVEQLEKEHRKKGGYLYRPIFKFTTVHGKEILYPHSVASSPPDWKIGEKVTVVYQTDAPDNPIVLTYFSAFGSAIILLAIAIVLLLIGGGNYVFGYYMKQFLV